ncbi:MAG: [FeFe] hydrogenase H-cluster maturation GTPase HydF [Sporomusaceae bacterium]|jgi:[FeFe] hydrogenase H-cluster maturation GTPase HydF|nr:[FeFe] hydrogenase H-cluster maturation GTPase HydF [Sporomusaceae bacterium]
MENTPKASRLQIAIFGRRNVGKSSLINALTNQETALVSPVAGTTADPVSKAMEILPLGPVVLIDTAGIDDVGELGLLRVEKTRQVLNKTDLAVLVWDAQAGFGEYEEELLADIKGRSLPVLGVVNKSDTAELSTADWQKYSAKFGGSIVQTSAKNLAGIEKLKQLIIENAPENWEGPPVLGDLVTEGAFVVLVTPIDESAPKGRLILPQNQAIRDALDHKAIALVVQAGELEAALRNLKARPDLVVTDSQEFKKVAAIVPEDILLTSFSILYARHKGDLKTLIQGAAAVNELKAGDKVLIAEGCTHHCQVADIGRVKIPKLLTGYVGGGLEFTWSTGGSFPADLEKYKLVVHCGACMLTRREMLHRITSAQRAKVNIVNYGVLIAKILGILPRVLQPFKIDI